MSIAFIIMRRITSPSMPYLTFVALFMSPNYILNSKTFQRMWYVSLISLLRRRIRPIKTKDRVSFYSRWSLCFNHDVIITIPGNSVWSVQKLFNAMKMRRDFYNSGFTCAVMWLSLACLLFILSLATMITASTFSILLFYSAFHYLLFVNWTHFHPMCTQT